MSEDKIQQYEQLRKRILNREFSFCFVSADLDSDPIHIALHSRKIKSVNETSIQMYHRLIYGMVITRKFPDVNSIVDMPNDVSWIESIPNKFGESRVRVEFVTKDQKEKVKNNIKNNRS